MNVDILDGEGGDFSNEYSAEGIGESSIYANDGKRGVKRVVIVKLDFEILYYCQKFDLVSVKGFHTSLNLSIFQQ